MLNIYYLFIMAICAVGVFLSGVYAKPIVARIKRLFTWKKRNTLARIEWLEGRTKIHDNKDSVYLKKFDELEEMINNVTKSSKTREGNLNRRVKKIVLEYLKELQKNG